MNITISDLEAMQENYVGPEIAAKVLGTNAQSIREQVRRDAKRFSIPTCVVGNRVKISRIGLIRWMRGDPDYNVRV